MSSVLRYRTRNIGVRLMSDDQQAHNKTYRTYDENTVARFDAYNELQVGDNASLPEIRQRWLKMSAETHPDRNPGDPHALERFKKIQEAWNSILENKKAGGGDVGVKTYICPDTLEEFKYDLEVRPIGIVETTEVNKIDKNHVECYDGTQNFQVFDPLYHPATLLSPLWIIIQYMLVVTAIAGGYAYYSYENNGIVAEYFGNAFEEFDIQKEHTQDDPSEKFRWIQLRQKARRELAAKRSVDEDPNAMSEEEEAEMIALMEQFNVRK